MAVVVCDHLICPHTLINSFTFPIHALTNYNVREPPPPRGGMATPYNGLYWEVLPKRGTFFRLQIQESVGISLNEVYQGGREVDHFDQ